MRDNGINTITYRRSLISRKPNTNIQQKNTNEYSLADPGDKEFSTENPVYIVWAIGRLDSNKEPTFHDYYPKANNSIHLSRKELYSTCTSFTRLKGGTKTVEPWKKKHIFDKSVRSFHAYLGPSGGKKGYQGLTGSIF